MKESVQAFGSHIMSSCDVLACPAMADLQRCLATNLHMADRWAHSITGHQMRALTGAYAHQRHSERSSDLVPTP